MATLPLTEPVPIDDDLCTALSHVEDMSFGGRLVFYAEQTSFETGDKIFVVKRKIVVPYPALRLGNALVRAFLESAPKPPLRRVT